MARIDRHARLHCAIAIIITTGLWQQYVRKAKHNEGTIIRHNRLSRAFKRKMVGLWVQHEDAESAL